MKTVTFHNSLIAENNIIICQKRFVNLPNLLFGQ
jgi:hypothetical protein